MSPEQKNNAIQLSHQEMAFIEEIGSHYENVYNLSRISCRILGLLLLAPRPLRMEEINHTLKISHSSASTKLNLLNVLGYVQKVTFPGDRCTYHQFHPHARVKVLETRIRHYVEMREIISKAQAELNLQGESVQRFEEMNDYAKLAIKKNTEFIEEWNNFYQAHTDTSP